MKQQYWFLLHHWAGFHVSLLLSFVLLTGTFATISTDLDWLTNPAIRAVNQVDDAQVLDWPGLLVTVNDNFPEAIIESIQRPHMPWHNVEVIARDINEKRFRIFIDAFDHQVTGQGVWLNWQRFFRQVHRHLMLPTQVGITIVGLLGLVMFFLLVTALYTYRHWWRYFFAFSRIKLKVNTSNVITPQKEAGKKRRFWSELHKIVGLWSLWFLVIISLTGIWYLVEKWGAGVQHIAIVNSSVTSTKHESYFQSSTVPSALSRAIQHINEHTPHYIINQIRVIANERVIEIDGQSTAFLVRDRANKQVFDSASGEYIGGRKGEDLNWHFRISEAADPLHFGTFSSWIFRYIWFLFGLALTFLSLTGVYMYLLRLRQVGLLERLSNVGSLRILWMKTRSIKWLSITLLMICSFLAIFDFIII
jgi:uncharacterized iron-regulated membrane protein